MKMRTLGRLALPDEASEGAILDLRTLARAGLSAQGDELWAAVRLALSELSPKVGSQVVFVAGGTGEREAVLTAVAVALGAARAGSAVILVDPGGLEMKLGSADPGTRIPGFAELVRGGSPGSSMHDTGLPGLVLVPAGQAAGGFARARFSADEVRETFDILRAHGETVVVPGSLWQGDEASSLLSVADAYIAVRSAGSGDEGELPHFNAPRALTGLSAVRLGVIEASFPGAGSAASRKAMARSPGETVTPVEDSAPRVPKPPAIIEHEAEHSTRGRSALRPVLVGGAVVALGGAVAVVALLNQGVLPFGERNPVASAGGGVVPAMNDSMTAIPVSAMGDSFMSDALVPDEAAVDGWVTGDTSMTPVGYMPVGDSAASAAEGASDEASAAPAAESAGGSVPPATSPGFAVIVASFKVRLNAEKTADQLRTEGHSPAVWEVERPGMGRWFRVVADTLATRDAADSLAASFREAGRWHDAVVVACE